MQEGQSTNRRVMLTGQQGNMTLSWEGTWALADWLRHGNWFRFYQGLTALSAYRQKSLLRYLKLAVAIALPDAVWQGYQRIRHSASGPTILDYSGINKGFLYSQRALERAEEAGFSSAFRVPFNGRKARWNVLNGVDFVGDMGAAHRAQFSVERRDPTGDRRLIDFCFAIPQEQFLGNGEHRWLVKRALSDRLPENVLHNKLCGDQDPGWYERLDKSRQQLTSYITQWAGQPEKNRVLDIRKLNYILGHWPDEGDCWNTPARLRDYRYCLMRSVMVGTFLEWFNDVNKY